MNPHIKLEIEGHVASIVMTRPKERNALSEELRQGLLSSRNNVKWMIRSAVLSCVARAAISWAAAISVFSNPEKK